MVASQRSFLPEDKYGNSEAIPTLFISSLVSIYISKETQPSVAMREELVCLETKKKTLVKNLWNEGVNFIW